MKDHQWKRLEAAGDIPKEALEAFRRSGKKEQRDIVNDTVVRHNDGSYTLNLKNKSLEVAVVKTRAITSGLETRGVCKQVAETRCGSAVALQAALNEGNCTMKLNAAGKERYYFEEELDQDFQITEGRQTLSGTMAVTDAQWR